ncbi:putative CDP-tyvelose-2-epimerase [Bradyrhizobium sp. STM 3843]|uniref:SDR family NAD(P)-dependent oxidoreductase n=1 Tax=Bradyrhizobium sp. STM 3843 TaxID=551947 RepID=UPI000240329F|nr:SDR family NAD(P)-dependent oxidoreductase [Bradyrhizobium sp. STM 3843]CCE11294.1 putative CDP-tyvelose-2-epimerase [Bradyrhizobium sp. STM 3843]
MTLSAAGKKSVLITGGCGFIGCNLADRLASRGDKVVVLDNLVRAGVRENAQWLKSRHADRISVVVGDVRDPITVIDVVREAGAVLHLAAQVAVTSSLQTPIDDFEINARGTLNVLEAVRLHNPAVPVVFASTNKVYGRLIDNSQIRRDGTRHVPRDASLAHGIAEDTPLDLYSPYGCSKGTADQYVRDYARIFGLNTAVLRMSCIYGPRQFGNEDQGWIAHFLLSALRGEKLTIYGDGLQVRDALYVADAADAWIGVLDNIERVSGRIFNLGGGLSNSISLIELIAMIQQISGKRPAFNFAEWRPGDQPWYVSDISSLGAAIGWTPATPLADGLQHLQGWLEGRFGRVAGGQEALA